MPPRECQRTREHSPAGKCLSARERQPDVHTRCDTSLHRNDLERVVYRELLGEVVVDRPPHARSDDERTTQHVELATRSLRADERRAGEDHDTTEAGPAARELVDDDDSHEQREGPSRFSSNEPAIPLTRFSPSINGTGATIPPRTRSRPDAGRRPATGRFARRYVPR